MHIKTAESVDRTISWFLIDKSTAHRLLGVTQTDVQKEATRWHAIICRVTKAGQPSAEGVAWTSKKDDFNVGTGMRLSLERALNGFDKQDRTEFWHVVGTNKEAAELITDVDAAARWALSAQRTLYRRTRSLVADDFVVGRFDSKDGRNILRGAEQRAS
jgi:hypothetical protein